MDRLRTCGGAEKDRRGRLRLRARAWRNLRLSRAAGLRPLLFRAQGRRRQDRGGDLENRIRPHAPQARGGARSLRHPPADDLSPPVEIPDRDLAAPARAAPPPPWPPPW